MTALSRRTMLGGLAVLPAAHALAQAPAAPQAVFGPTASVVSTPPRQWGPGAPTNIYPDPDVITLDPAFNVLRESHGTIRRVATGYQWAEGPAWSGQGQFVVFSDVMGDIQYRYIWDADIVLPYRRPSFNSNGNSFDFQGRQISAQHFNRRLVRWEHDGAMTVLADNFNGQPLNSPNDIAPHPDGSIWFTDPPFGSRLSEGHPDIGEAPMNPRGVLNPAIGNSGAGIISAQKQVLPHNVYRLDPLGRLDLVVPFEQGLGPNGICFSPDYRRLYGIRGGRFQAGDVQCSRVTGMRLFADMMIDGVRCGTDGMRADKLGNVWASSSGPLGYAGVTVWNPDGKAIGRVRLPETCANLCFAGPKRDWLFMTASQSVYMLRLGIQGAAPG